MGIELDYKDVMIAVAIMSVVLGSFLSALGLWELKRQKSTLDR